MKNLKLFVFALCAVLLSVVTVNAACYLPGATPVSGQNQCPASYGGQTYDSFWDAWKQFIKNGGTLDVYVDAHLQYVPTDATPTITKSGSVINLNGHKLIVEKDSVVVNAKASLTVENGSVEATIANAFDVKKDGALTLNNLKGTYASNAVVNRGTTTITGGEYTSAANSSAVLYNEGTLNVSNATITAAKASASVVENRGTATLTNLKVTAKSASLVNVAKHATTTNLVSGTYKVNHVFVSPGAVPTPADEDAETAAEVPANVVVSGGTYTTEGYAMYPINGVVVTVNGGTFTAKTGNAIDLNGGVFTVNNGTFTAKAGNGVYVNGNSKLTIKNGTFVSESKTDFALTFVSNKATYAISGGTFESTGLKDRAAIFVNIPTVVEDNVTMVDKSIRGILTGGLYLNKVISYSIKDHKGANVDLANQLVAEGYTVKDTTKDDKEYEEIVSTKAPAETTKPGAPGKEEAPNTFDAGLVYMGLALSAIGASVVSVRKLRNN